MFTVVCELRVCFDRLLVVAGDSTTASNPWTDTLTSSMWHSGAHQRQQALSTYRLRQLLVAITGHSRNGKQSLIAAAYDERITAVADSSSGSPAGSPYRLTSAWSEYTRNVPLLVLCGCILIDCLR
jgi:hypothetical protein